MGIVYFAKCKKRVKIGLSSEATVRRRLSTVQLSCPDKIAVLGCIAGTRETELAIHELFADFRLRGEWFRLVPEIIEYINANKNCDLPPKKKPPGRPPSGGPTPTMQLGRVSPEDQETLRAAAKRSGKSFTEWALHILLREARKK